MVRESDIAAVDAATMRTPAARARLDWIDALKGIGILAVVAGHVWTRGPVRDAIYAVHMPLFFILSGYTARHVPWRTLLPSALHSLGLPFLSFSALLLAADFLIEGLRGVRPIFPGWWAGATTILFATEKLRGPFTILWFIPCLFIARLCWNGLTAGNRRPDGMVILFAMLVVALLTILAPDLGRSPFGLLAVPGALFLIWLGALWRQWGQPGRVIFTIVALLAGVVFTIFPPLNMKLGDSGWPLVSLLGAGAVTILLARIVQSLPVRLIGALAVLGRASLVIMYVHVALIHYLAPYAPKGILFLVAVAASLGLERLIRLSPTARKWLLGQVRTAQ